VTKEEERFNFEQGPPKVYPLRINAGRLEAWRKASVYEGAPSLHQWLLDLIDQKTREVLHEIEKQADGEDNSK